MGSMGNDHKTTSQSDEEDCLYAIQLVSCSVMPMVMQAAMELNLFHVIGKAGEGAQLSPSEIASHLASDNPEAPIMLDRMLRLLATYSVVTCSIVTLDDGSVERLYGLAPVCKYLLPNKNGVSLASWLSISTNKFSGETLSGLKDAVVEGGSTFNRVHGEDMYKYFENDPEQGKLFDKFMFDHTSIVMTKILEKYEGFEDVKEMVDVGGRIGTMSSIITNMYPKIKCINFDLPNVIEHAPSYPRVKNVGGDMFVNVPKGDAIFLKWILHNWKDDDCVILLKNCYQALPDHGKVIVVDVVVPIVPEPNAAGKGLGHLDLQMMVFCPGGKERTKKEFEVLAKKAGFCGIKLVCSACNYWVMEFYKTI